VIGRIEAALLTHGALGVSMSGSGPTVFGMFETEKACRAAADGLTREKWRIYPAETLTESPMTEHLV